MCRYTLIRGSVYGTVSSQRAKFHNYPDQTQIPHRKKVVNLCRRLKMKQKLKFRIKAIFLCFKILYIMNAYNIIIRTSPINTLVEELTEAQKKPFLNCSMKMA